MRRALARSCFCFSVVACAAGVAGLGMIGGGGGCAAFDDARLPVKDGGPGSSGGDGGDTGTSSVSEAGCPVERIPTERPVNAPAQPEMELVFAVHNIDLGIRAVDGGTALSPTFGYDLDNACTCPTELGTCTPAKLSVSKQPNAPVDPHCDGEKGRDDSTGSLLAGLAASIGDPAIFANEAIDTGVRGVLMRVSGYNGLDDDAKVTVAVYRSIGPGAGNEAPHFDDPTQAWSVDQEDIALNQNATWGPKNFADGFVKGKLLVVRLTTSVFPFNSDADILLKEVSLTGTLEKDAASGQWSLNSAIAVGRWPISNAIESVVRVKEPQKSGKRICETSLVGFVTAVVCNATDIMEQSIDDSAKSKPLCNAMSTAVGFVGSAAKLGDIVVPDRVNPCVGVTVPGCPPD